MINRISLINPYGGKVSEPRFALVRNGIALYFIQTPIQDYYYIRHISTGAFFGIHNNRDAALRVFREISCLWDWESISKNYFKSIPETIFSACTYINSKNYKWDEVPDSVEPIEIVFKSLCRRKRHGKEVSEGLFAKIHSKYCEVFRLVT